MLKLFHFNSISQFNRHLLLDQVNEFLKFSSTKYFIFSEIKISWLLCIKGNYLINENKNKNCHPFFNNNFTNCKIIASKYLLNSINLLLWNWWWNNIHLVSEIRDNIQSYCYDLTRIVIMVGKNINNDSFSNLLDNIAK